MVSAVHSNAKSNDNDNNNIVTASNMLMDRKLKVIELRWVTETFYNF